MRWRAETSRGDDALVAGARAAVESTGLPGRFWAVGDFRDDRPCLVRESDEWIAGYVERGRFDEEFREADTGTAVARFVLWVRAVLESSATSAAATAEWLSRTGRDRP